MRKIITKKCAECICFYVLFSDFRMDDFTIIRVKNIRKVGIRISFSEIVEGKVMGGSRRDVNDLSCPICIDLNII